METLVNALKRAPGVRFVYGANLLLAFHYFLVIYVLSSYLETFWDESQVSLLYIIGSAVNLGLFLAAPRAVRAFGRYRYLLAVFAATALSAFGLIASDTRMEAALFFILQQASIPMVLFALDIFLEDASVNEVDTGKIRGAYLTLANIALVVSPAIAGWLMKSGGYGMVFLVSAAFLVPFAWTIMRKFPQGEPAAPARGSLVAGWRAVMADKDIKAAVLAHMALQFFYGWMVIYLPIYLTTTVGMGWDKVGILFSFMLLPFVLVELPAGSFADKSYGEKEIMMTGFAIAALATTAIPFPAGSSFVLWAAILFMTRVGAALVEVTVESYFFKHVSASDTDRISVFRMMRPAGFLAAPAVAGAWLSVYSMQTGFFVLALSMAAGALIASRITDTR